MNGEPGGNKVSSCVQCPVAVRLEGIFALKS